MDFFLNTKAVQCLQDNCKWITCLYKSICNTCTPKIRKENFTSLSLTPNTGIVTYTCACECSNRKFKNAFFSLFILITQHTHTHGTKKSHPHPTILQSSQTEVWALSTLIFAWHFALWPPPQPHPPTMKNKRKYFWREGTFIQKALLAYITKVLDKKQITKASWLKCPGQSFTCVLTGFP